MADNGLTVETLRDFKENATDENSLIAAAIAELLPADAGGMILDIGAGLGDIAERAFPGRSAVLLDTLEFPPSMNLRHRRLRGDFMRFTRPDDWQVDCAILSHVMQYLDNEPALLTQRLAQLDAAAFITVLNEPDRLQQSAIEWLESRGVGTNAERPELTLIPDTHRAADEARLTGTLRCGTFEELARQVSQVLFDADPAPDEIAGLAGWFSRECGVPVLKIPQQVKLYVRSR